MHSLGRAALGVSILPTSSILQVISETDLSCDQVAEHHLKVDKCPSSKVLCSTSHRQFWQKSLESKRANWVHRGTLASGWADRQGPHDQGQDGKKTSCDTEMGQRVIRRDEFCALVD